MLVLDVPEKTLVRAEKTIAINKNFLRKINQPEDRWDVRLMEGKLARLRGDHHQGPAMCAAAQERLVVTGGYSFDYISSGLTVLLVGDRAQADPILRHVVETEASFMVQGEHRETQQYLVEAAYFLGDNELAQSAAHDYLRHFRYKSTSKQMAAWVARLAHARVTDDTEAFAAAADEWYRGLRREVGGLENAIEPTSGWDAVELVLHELAERTGTVPAGLRQA